MSLVYCPVSTDNNNLVNNYHPNCLFNPIRQMPDIRNSLSGTSYFGDSGGYQLYRYNDHETKRCIVVPAVGIRNGAKLLVIDPLDLCKRYNKLGVKYGFTLDRPLSEESTHTEFINNLTESYGWAHLMYEHRSRLCPNTELLIPLHYSTKNQLHHAFKKMAQLNPDGYAFPVRGCFDFAWLIWIACTLSFLSSMGVQKVHMFGSSRREVIFIGAAALGLQMFEQISFDSMTWNTLVFDKRPKYFDPDTLKGHRIKNEEIIDILTPTRVMTKTQLFPLDIINRKRLLMLHNALAISQYAEDMAKMARNIDLFKEYLGEQSYCGSRTKTAIEVLKMSKTKGYKYLQKSLNWIWK